jgi:hypothetical protein
MGNYVSKRNIISNDFYRFLLNPFIIDISFGSKEYNNIIEKYINQCKKLIDNFFIKNNIYDDFIISKELLISIQYNNKLLKDNFQETIKDFENWKKINSVISLLYLTPDLFKKSILIPWYIISRHNIIYSIILNSEYVEIIIGDKEENMLIELSNEFDNYMEEMRYLQQSLISNICIKKCDDLTTNQKFNKKINMNNIQRLIIILRKYQILDIIHKSYNIEKLKTKELQLLFNQLPFISTNLISKSFQKYVPKTLI